MAEPKTSIELVTEPPLPAPVDLGAILAKRRERAVAENAERERAKATPKPHDRNGVFGLETLTVEEKLALLGISAEELRSVLKKGEG